MQRLPFDDFITHWLEKVELPTEEETENKAQYHVSPISFICGVEYVTDLLIK